MAKCEPFQNDQMAQTTLGGQFDPEYDGKFCQNIHWILLKLPFHSANDIWTFINRYNGIRIRNFHDGISY